MQVPSTPQDWKLDEHSHVHHLAYLTIVITVALGT